MDNKTMNCYHDQYCSLNEFICETTDFSKFCSLKETPLEELPLLKAVKERVDRDKARGFTFLNEKPKQSIN